MVEDLTGITVLEGLTGIVVVEEDQVMQMVEQTGGNDMECAMVAHHLVAEHLVAYVVEMMG